MKNQIDTKELNEYVSVRDLRQEKPSRIPHNAIDAVGAFLLLHHQAGNTVSVFRQTSDGVLEPLFEREWLSRQLRWLKANRDVRSCTVHDYWKSGIGWAEEELHNQIRRRTLSEFRQDDYYQTGIGDQDLQIKLALLESRLGLPNWRRVVFAPKPGNPVIEKEYPGWIFVLAFDAPLAVASG